MKQEHLEWNPYLEKFIQNINLAPTKLKQSFHDHWQCTDFADVDILKMLKTKNDELVKSHYLKEGWVI